MRVPIVAKKLGDRRLQRELAEFVTESMPATKSDLFPGLQNGTVSARDAFSTPGIGRARSHQLLAQRDLLRRVELHASLSYGSTHSN